MQTGVQGVLVGRGVLRNPWILAQAADLAAGRPPREVSLEDRGRFLLDYIELLTNERVREPEGFRHSFECQDGDGLRAPNHESRQVDAGVRSHDRWVINKLRALGSWFTKGLDNGSHLRTAINSAESLDELRDRIGSFFPARSAQSSEPVSAV